MKVQYTTMHNKADSWAGLVEFRTIKGQSPVYLVYDPSLQHAVVDISVRAGSRDEKPGLYGVAHFLEHALFSMFFENGQSWLKVWEERGLRLNGTTTRDRTRYTCECPLALLNSWIKAESVRLSLGPNLWSLDLDNERRVIINEAQGKEYSDRSLNAFGILSAGFSEGHAYARPVIGNISDILEITETKLIQFFNEHYRSNRICMTIRSPLESASLWQWIERVWDPGSRDDVPSNQKTGFNFLKSHSQSLEIEASRHEEKRFVLFWNTEGYGSRESMAIDIFVEALKLSWADSFIKNCDMKIKHSTFELCGMLSIELQFSRNNDKADLKMIRSHLIKTINAISKDQFAVARTRLIHQLSQKQNSLLGVGSLTDRINADHQFLARAFNPTFERESIESLQMAEFKNMVMGVLKLPQKLTFFSKRLENRNDHCETKSSRSAPSIRYGFQLPTMTPQTKGEDKFIWQSSCTSQGHKVFFQYRPLDTVDHYGLGMSGGSSQWPGYRFVARLIETISVRAFHCREMWSHSEWKMISHLDPRINIFRSGSLFEILSSRPFHREMMEVLQSILCEPRWSDEIWQHTITHFSKICSHLDGDLSFNIEKYLRPLLLGSDHSDSLMSFPEKHQLEQVSLRDIRVFYSSLWLAKNKAHFFCGANQLVPIEFSVDVDEADYKEKINKICGSATSKDLDAIVLAGEDIYLKKIGGYHRTTLVAGFSMDSKNQSAVVPVLARVLGNHASGRLRKRLRDELGLTYGVLFQFVDNCEKPLFWVSFETDQGNREWAFKEFKCSLERLFMGLDPLTCEELCVTDRAERVRRESLGQKFHIWLNGDTVERTMIGDSELKQLFINIWNTRQFLCLS